MVRRQLFIGVCAPGASRIKSIVNRYPMSKPQGGLWTSTYTPKTGSAWITWCAEEQPSWLEDRKAWLLRPSATARVWTIAGLPDLMRLHQQYGMTATTTPHGVPAEMLEALPGINYEALACDYDAVHLTDAGQWRTRLTWPLNLYGWDCESVLWFRWCFESVRPVAMRWTPAAATVDE